MELKDKKYFYFTQNSLSTFVNCPYRFKKKYIDNVKWQQDESDDAQEKVDFGLDFHKIAERYFKGIPVYEESFCDNEELYNSYINLKDEFKLEETNQYYPEYTIRFSDGFMRLEANIDLIVIKEDGSVEIFDWKTNASPANSKKYISSLQTAVYMFALKRCMKDIFQFDVECSKIKMVYFSPERKEKIAEIKYSEEMFKNDEKKIGDLIKKVYNYDYGSFDKEDYSKQCKFCEFINFCNNKVSEELVDLKKWNFDEIDEVSI